MYLRHQRGERARQRRLRLFSSISSYIYQLRDNDAAGAQSVCVGTAFETEVT